MASILRRAASLAVRSASSLVGQNLVPFASSAISERDAVVGQTPAHSQAVWSTPTRAILVSSLGQQAIPRDLQRLSDLDTVPFLDALGPNARAMHAKVGPAAREVFTWSIATTRGATGAAVTAIMRSSCTRATYHRLAPTDRSRSKDQRGYQAVLRGSIPELALIVAAPAFNLPCLGNHAHALATRSVRRQRTANRHCGRVAQPRDCGERCVCISIFAVDAKLTIKVAAHTLHLA
jgi:hypothetical protein